MGELTFKNKERKKILMKIRTMIFVIGLFSSLFTLFSQANAAENTAEYVAHEVIPGNEKGAESFVEYLNQLYKFGIGIAAVLALGMIAFGAFSYIVTSAGNATKMGDAKGMIFSAVLGLTLAMVSWLLLYLVNPDLVGKLKELNGSSSGMSSKGCYKEGCPEKFMPSSDEGNCPEGEIYCVKNKKNDKDESCKGMGNGSKSLICGKGKEVCWNTKCVTPCKGGLFAKACGYLNSLEGTGEYYCWEDKCTLKGAVADEGETCGATTTVKYFSATCKKKGSCNNSGDRVINNNGNKAWKKCKSGLVCCAPPSF